MLKVALRGVLARKFRLALTGLAVLLGVSFVTHHLRAHRHARPVVPRRVRAAPSPVSTSSCSRARGRGRRRSTSASPTRRSPTCGPSTGSRRRTGSSRATRSSSARTATRSTRGRADVRRVVHRRADRGPLRLVDVDGRRSRAPSGARRGRDGRRDRPRQRVPRRRHGRRALGRTEGALHESSGCSRSATAARSGRSRSPRSISRPRNGSWPGRGCSTRST